MIVRSLLIAGSVALASQAFAKTETPATPTTPAQEEAIVTTPGQTPEASKQQPAKISLVADKTEEKKPEDKKADDATAPVTPAKISLIAQVASEEDRRDEEERTEIRLVHPIAAKEVAKEEERRDEENVEANPAAPTEPRQARIASI